MNPVKNVLREYRRQIVNRAVYYGGERERASATIYAYHQTHNLILDFRQIAREGGHLSYGRGGWTLHVGTLKSIQGYGGLEQPIPLLAILLGVPVINTRTIPDEVIDQVIAFPMARAGCQQYGPFTAWDYAPLAYVARLYQALGATLYNFPTVESNF
jgi:hypothetical protein